MGHGLGFPKRLKVLRGKEAPPRFEVKRFSHVPLEVNVLVCDTKSDRYFFTVKVVENEKLCSSNRTFSDVPKLLNDCLRDVNKTVLRLNPILNRL